MNIVVILLLSAVTYSTASGSCPGDWIYLEGGCYTFSSGTATWDQAKAACENMGAKLAVVNSDAKQTAIQNQLNGESHWIGLYRDPEDSSNWLWVDQTQFCNGFWKVGEPNNVGGREDCAVTRPTQLWNDATCSKYKHYVCELTDFSGCSGTSKLSDDVKRGSAQEPVKKSADGSRA